MDKVLHQKEYDGNKIMMQFHDGKDMWLVCYDKYTGEHILYKNKKELGRSRDREELCKNVKGL